MAEYASDLANIAATLAASLQPKDADDAVRKYRKVLAVLKETGGAYKSDDTPDTRLPPV